MTHLETQKWKVRSALTPFFDVLYMQANEILIPNVAVSESRSGGKHKVKRKSKRRKSTAAAAALHRPSGNASDDSESSLDEVLKDYMETIANQSDSDDMAHITQLQTLLNFKGSHSISVAESDSFTENFSPMRLGRRRRRFKRMAVDTQPDSEASITDYLREQRSKRLTTLKPKMKSQTSLIDDMTIDSESTLERDPHKGDAVKGASAETIVPCDITVGKRKRGMRAGNSLDMLDDDSGQSKCNTDAMYVDQNMLPQD